MNSINRLIRSLHHLIVFPERQKVGVVSLLIILTLATQVPLLFVNKPVVYSEADSIVFYKEINAFYEQFEVVKDAESRENKRTYLELLHEKYDTLSLFNFNPNTTPFDSLLALGLTEKQIRILQNYLKKGGRYVFKSDLRKLYGLPVEQFNYLKPYISLPLNRRRQLSQSNGMAPVVTNMNIELFNFDPNTVNRKELLRLGFSKKQAASILKYRNSGVVFKKKLDFIKCYAVNDSIYNLLESYITISSVLNAELEDIVLTKKGVNFATSIDFMKINGVGEYSAKLIIKYRERLGGFVFFDQLSEIKGLKVVDSLLYMKLFELDTPLIIKCNVNRATFNELKKHPYIGVATAKTILQRRETIGFFTDVYQLREERLLTKHKFEKLHPYLSIE